MRSEGNYSKLTTSGQIPPPIPKDGKKTGGTPKGTPTEAGVKKVAEKEGISGIKESHPPKSGNITRVVKSIGSGLGSISKGLRNIVREKLLGYKPSRDYDTNSAPVMAYRGLLPKTAKEKKEDLKESIKNGMKTLSVQKSENTESAGTSAKVFREEYKSDKNVNIRFHVDGQRLALDFKGEHSQVHDVTRDKLEPFLLNTGVSDFKFLLQALPLKSNFEYEEKMKMLKDEAVLQNPGVKDSDFKESRSFEIDVQKPKSTGGETVIKAKMTMILTFQDPNGNLKSLSNSPEITVKVKPENIVHGRVTDFEIL